MTARILDGTKIRDLVFADLANQIRDLAADSIKPGLAAVLVGENPASQLYVKSKIAACEQLGMTSWLHTPPASVKTAEMLDLVAQLNADDSVDGILIQLPLPKQVDTKAILEAVDPAKDVDGFHPVSLGALVSGRPGLVACTPAGCMEILRRGEIKIEGANAVVLGRSDIVGKPMALLLMHANATVTICHSKTRDLPDVVHRADIVVAAMGKAGYVAADWIRPGAAVIDVGTNKVTDVAEAERLVKNFPADGPVNVNKATSAQLQSGLGLTAAEADAVIAYRKKNGDFKTIDDLKKVPDLDVKKVDAKKDHLAF